MGPPIFIGGNFRLTVNYPRQSLASMGPPIFIGGNRPSGREKRSSLWCFNGATDFHRWKYLGDFRRQFMRKWLQWGHRFSSVEMGKVEVAHASLGEASMGPPIFIGGNTISRKSRSLLSVPLQWGHRFSSVEITLTLGSGANVISLQWGHRFSSVEIITSEDVLIDRVDASMGPPIFIGGNCCATE